MDLGPLPHRRALATAPHPSSPGSHLRSFPAPTPAARLGPWARPRLFSPSYSALTSHKGTGDWKHSRNHTTSSMRTTHHRAHPESTQPRRPACVIRLPCKEHSRHQGTTTRNVEKGRSPGAPTHPSNPMQGLPAPPAQGRPGHRRVDRAPFPLPDKPHTSPLPRLSKQAGGEVMFGAGAARRELP